MMECTDTGFEGGTMSGHFGNAKNAGDFFFVPKKGRKSDFPHINIPQKCDFPYINIPQKTKKNNISKISQISK